MSSRMQVQCTLALAVCEVDIKCNAPAPLHWQDT
jgi:hypothetical protein